MLSKSDFKKYYFQYYKDIYSYLNNRIYNKLLIEDFTQDVFIKLWNKRDQFDKTKNIKPYLYKIAQNHIIDHYKLVKNQIQFDEVDDNQKSDEYDLVNVSESIDDIFHHIPTRDRIIFFMNRFDGFTQKEIAKLLGLSIKTIEKRISITLRNIQEYTKNS
jgi:RNA polymerase sigma factor (sigma-70 family)